MKLNDVSSSPAAPLHLEEQYFSIENQGMIFDILRNKMYSDPISAICREVSCNARDAHREVGTPEKPIHIYLPNSVESFLKIKDFGPGISPERISNIFIKYAASTKRNDNAQTGGFGLGAKTPFAYSDSFNIITNYQGKQYNYVCFIDETKIGKISLLSENVTDEPNGTEVVVPIKQYDYRQFAEAIEFATRHWEVKPIIKGLPNNSELNYKDIAPILSGTNWQISPISGYNRGVKAVIDGIEYPIPSEYLRDSPSFNLVQNCREDVFLTFGIGELSLSANREQIYFDAPTKQKVKDAMASFTDEVHKVISSKIKNAVNLWEANIIFHKLVSRVFTNSNFFPKTLWNNCELNNNYRLQLDCQVIHFTKGVSSHYRSSDSTRISRYFTKYVSFTDNSVLMVNDLDVKEISSRHLKKFFDANRSVKSVQIIFPHTGEGKCTLDFLNSNYNLKEMQPIPLSKIVNVSTRKSSKSGASRLIIYKYFTSSTSEYRAGIRQVPANFVEEDSNKKIICRIKKDSYTNDKVICLNDRPINVNILGNYLSHIKDYSLYCVDMSVSDSKVDEYFSDADTLEEFLEEKVYEDSSLNFDELMHACHNVRKINQSLIRYTDELVTLINDKDSAFAKKLLLEQKIYNLYYNKREVLNLHSLLHPDYHFDMEGYINNHPENNIELLNEKIKEKYLMLKHVGSIDYSSVHDIINYINLVDKG
jgi:hypothetical protein